MSGLLDEAGEHSIDGPAGGLQLVVTQARGQSSAQRVVVICHPHPLHGGTMDNKVVTTLERAYRDLGFVVVRFNFRGVGLSEGVFDEGRGELDDLLAVTAWLNDRAPEYQLYLAGFSFGSAMAAAAAYRVENLQHLLLVAPPVERYRFDLDGVFPSPVCVVQGGSDERVNALGVYSWVRALRSEATLVRMPEAGHFFHGLLAPLRREVSEKLKLILNAPL